MYYEMEAFPIPHKILLHWLATEAERSLTTQQLRDLVYDGVTYSIDMKRGTYRATNHGISYPISAFLATGEEDDDYRPAEFLDAERKTSTYVHLPPCASYPFLVKNGIAINEDLVLVSEGVDKRRLGLYRRASARPLLSTEALLALVSMSYLLFAILICRF